MMGHGVGERMQEHGHAVDCYSSETVEGRVQADEGYYLKSIFEFFTFLNA